MTKAKLYGLIDDALEDPIPPGVLEGLRFSVTKLSEEQTEYRFVVPRTRGSDVDLPNESLAGESARARICLFVLGYAIGTCRSINMHHTADELYRLATAIHRVDERFKAKAKEGAH